MRNRILSILLCLCMAACMLPTVAFAADTGKAIRLGTDALNKNVNTAAAPTVYFGQDHENNPGAWRVFGYNGSGVAGAQDGLLPFMGANGNWWIGEKDTGVKASDAADPAGSANTSATSPVLIIIGAAAGLALLGNLGLILYIALKKKKSLV